MDYLTKTTVYWKLYHPILFVPRIQTIDLFHHFIREAVAMFIPPTSFPNNTLSITSSRNDQTFLG